MWLLTKDWLWGIQINTAVIIGFLCHHLQQFVTDHFDFLGTLGCEELLMQLVSVNAGSNLNLIDIHHKSKLTSF